MTMDLETTYDSKLLTLSVCYMGSFITIQIRRLTRRLYKDYRIRVIAQREITNRGKNTLINRWSGGVFRRILGHHG